MEPLYNHSWTGFGIYPWSQEQEKIAVHSIQEYDDNNLFQDNHLSEFVQSCGILYQV